MDNGYSGTSFERPSWLELIEKIETGEVSTLIVKNMSRLGRDYLKVGFYTEVLFVEKGVWFIAINNGIDSANQQDSDFTPFLNIINKWYPRGSSKGDIHCIKAVTDRFMESTIIVMSEITLFADAIKVKIKNNGLISYKLKEKDTQNRP